LLVKLIATSGMKVFHMSDVSIEVGS